MDGAAWMQESSLLSMRLCVNEADRRLFNPPGARPIGYCAYKVREKDFVKRFSLDKIALIFRLASILY